MPAAVPLAIVGSTVVGSMISSSGAKSAADKQAQAAQSASAAQLQAAEDSIAAQQQGQQAAQANTQPWINSGASALAQLGRLLGINIPGSSQYSAPATSGNGTVTGGPTGGFSGTGSGTGSGNDVLSTLENTPGYKFSLQQGLNAVENSAAARGMQLSGATLKDLNNFAQGTAQSTYQQNVGNLESLAGLGQSSSGQAASGALQTGANIGNTLTGTAAAIGQNTIGAGNAAAAGQVASSNAIGGGLSSLGQMYTMGQLFGGGGSSWGTGISNMTSDPIGTMNTLNGWTS